MSLSDTHPFIPIIGFGIDFLDSSFFHFMSTLVGRQHTITNYFEFFSTLLPALCGFIIPIFFTTFIQPFLNAISIFTSHHFTAPCGQLSPYV